MPGHHLQNGLRKQGYYRSVPSFYQEVVGMVEAGLIEQRATPEAINGYQIKVYEFRITSEGRGKRNRLATERESLVGKPASALPGWNPSF